MVLTTSATSDGFVLIVSGANGKLRRLATLRVDGLEADRWVGTACLTGSARYVAVAFGPSEMTNDPLLRDRGAFGVVVRVDDGAIRWVHERVALKYHTPGCGPVDEVEFLRSEGVDQSATTLLDIDAASGEVLRRRTVAGQVTSPAPVGSRVFAAADRSLIDVEADGRTQPVEQTGGAVFGLVTRLDGGVDYLSTDGARVQARRGGHSGSESSLLAEGPIGSVRVARADSGGTRLVLGSGGQASGAEQAVRVDDPYSEVSLRGSTVVTTTSESEGEVSVTTSGSGGTATSQVGAASKAAAPAAIAAVNATTPKCAVARNDPTFLAMQPTRRPSARNSITRVGAVVVPAITIAAVASPVGAAGYPNITPLANYVGLVGSGTGCPGTTAVGTVRGIQTMLWVTGSYGTPIGNHKSKVDGVWGPTTKQAVNVYQFWNGLGVDGCVGWNTSTNMRNRWHRIPGDPITAWGRAQRYTLTANGAEVRYVRDMYSSGCYWFSWNGWKSFDSWQSGAWGENGCADGGGGWSSSPPWTW